MVRLLNVGIWLTKTCSQQCDGHIYILSIFAQDKDDLIKICYWQLQSKTQFTVQSQKAKNGIKI